MLLLEFWLWRHGGVATIARAPDRFDDGGDG